VFAVLADAEGIAWLTPPISPPSSYTDRSATDPAKVTEVRDRKLGNSDLDAAAEAGTLFRVAPLFPLRKHLGAVALRAGV
jgi:hypothetical protein